MAKKVLIAFCDEQLEEIDYIAQKEHRTRCDLVREAMRRYKYEFERRHGAIVKVPKNGKSVASLAGIEG